MSRWKVGDTQPPMIIDCFDGANLRADLSDATLVKVKVTQRGVLKWERTLADRPSDGTLTIPLQASDVATPGTYFVKAYAEWPGGSKQHYPPADDYMTMTVTR
jgi:hypothetical protein